MECRRRPLPPSQCWTRVWTGILSEAGVQCTIHEDDSDDVPLAGYVAFAAATTLEGYRRIS